MNLIMSRTLADATQDAAYLQGAVLTPMAQNLSGLRAATDTSPEACLRYVMAARILDMMEAFAKRRHIGVRTEMSFTQALSLLVNDPGTIPGFAPERVETTDKLKALLATPALDRRYRSLKTSDGLFLVMAAVVLAAARAQAGEIEGQEDVFPEGSVLHDPQSAMRFLMRLHAPVSMRGADPSLKVLPALSDKDILKIRMIYDITESTLPEIDPGKLHDEHKARISAMLSDPDVTREGATISLAESRAGA